MRTAAPTFAATLALVTAVAAQPPPTAPTAPPHETFFYTHEGLRLEAYYYRPPGRGAVPLVVYNHGSASAGQERIERPAGFLAAPLLAKGYAVLVPERRGYGRSEGKTLHEEIDANPQEGYGPRVRAEVGDVLAAVDHVASDPSFRVDGDRRAMVGYSFGAVVTTFAVSGRHDFAAAVVQAPGALSWGRIPELQVALPRVAAEISIPMLCQVASNDATTESTRAVCAAVERAPAELKVYPPFTPTPPAGPGVAPGHTLFSPQGLDVWKDDVLAFLSQHFRSPSP